MGLSCFGLVGTGFGVELVRCSVVGALKGLCGLMDFNPEPNLDSPSNAAIIPEMPTMKDRKGSFQGHLGGLENPKHPQTPNSGRWGSHRCLALTRFSKAEGGYC